MRLEGADREPKILAYAAFDLTVWRVGANGSARPKVPGLRFDRIYLRRRVRCERPALFLYDPDPDFGVNLWVESDRDLVDPDHLDGLLQLDSALVDGIP